jgi:nucleoside transporter
MRALGTPAAPRRTPQLQSGLDRGIRSRLALMMFLQYFIWGAWYVTLGTWLARGLRFSGPEIGLAAGATAVGAIVSPFLVGLIADKTFATQKLLGALHLAGAVLLLVAARQQSFALFYPTILLYCLCYMPTLSLTTSLAMRQMKDPQREFGPIRVLGTVGWIAAGLIVGALALEATSMPIRMAAACSVVMGAYCFTLPDTPPLARPADNGKTSVLSKEALAFLRTRSMAVFVAASFLICIPLQFYYAFTNLYLNEAGVLNAAGKMTGGQMSELVFMLLLPWFFTRVGVKYMLVIAMLAWVLRYLLFAFGNAGPAVWALWGGILLHGICYDFFFVTGQIYIDQKANVALRGGAQGLITLITYGMGMLVGSWLSGLIVGLYSHAPAGGGALVHDWRHIWLFCAACSAVVLVAFLLSFKERESLPAEALKTVAP